MLQQALRFGAVGLVNTLLGFAAVLAALQAGFGDYAANAFGYAVGLSVGFVLNRAWSFEQVERRREQFPLYLAAFALSYGANLAVLVVLRLNEGIPVPLAHLAAMTVYTACFYGLCRVLVFSPRQLPAVRFSPLEVSLAATAIVGAPFAAQIAVSHDVVWQLWIARQMAHGATLYVDIIEVNPPLWFWMGLAAQRTGEFFAVDPAVLLKVAIWFWAAFSAYVVGLLCPELDSRRRMGLVAFVFALCALLPLHSYGQREHLVLIASLPYLMLLAARARGLRVDAWLVLAIGMAAAFGFALKHYFVLVPLVGEAWLLFRLRRDYRLVRLELVVLAVAAALYAVAVVLWARPFLTEIVPMVGLAYDGYKSPLLAQINEPEQLIWLVAAICLAKFGLPREAALRRIAEILLLGTAVFLMAYVFQQKGWQYHAVPATGTVLLAVFVSFLLSVKDRPKNELILPGFTCGFALLLSCLQGPYRNRHDTPVSELLADMPAGSSFLALTTNPSRTWPMSDEQGLAWPSRYFAFWMIPSIGVDMAAAQPDPALQRLGRQVVRNTVDDMRCNPPQRLFVEVTPSNHRLREVEFRMLEFFMRSAEFREIMHHYRLVDSSEVHAVYDLVRPYGPVADTVCREDR